MGLRVYLYMSDRDSELLREYVDTRSDRAFTELVQRNLDFAYAAALRQVRDSHLAADVVQGVFIDLARKAERLRSHPALVCWLFKSVRFGANKALRSEIRRKAREQVVDVNDTTADNESVNAWAQISPLIDEALQDLDDRSRSAVLLRFFKKSAFADVASALATSEDNARQITGREGQRAPFSPPTV